MALEAGEGSEARLEMCFWGTAVRRQLGTRTQGALGREHRGQQGAGLGPLVTRHCLQGPGGAGGGVCRGSQGSPLGRAGPLSGTRSLEGVQAGVSGGLCSRLLGRAGDQCEGPWPLSRAEAMQASGLGPCGSGCGRRREWRMGVKARGRGPRPREPAGKPHEGLGASETRRAQPRSEWTWMMEFQLNYFKS